MTLTSSSIPSLINGVSQQPDSVRLSSQCTLQENGLSSIVEGLAKRPPREYVAKLTGSLLNNVFTHTINRDLTEKYFVVIKDDDLFVYDDAGTAKTVSFPDGKGYLDSTDPRKHFSACTIADYTFISNSSITTAMDADTVDSFGSVGLVHIKQGNYGSNYYVYVNGVQKGLKTTSTTDVTDIRTEDIASELGSDLTTNLGAGWAVTVSQSTIQIKKNDGSSFVLGITDSQGGRAMGVVKDKVSKFDDLPSVAPTDFVVAVAGTNDNNYDDYYVKFQPYQSTETFGSGRWIETVKPGIQYKFDPSTMPHLLIRNGDGTFTFKRAEDAPDKWGERVAGDTDTAPNPSFVGKGITEIFLAENRLAFASADKTIYSRAGEYFDFFPETVRTYLDSNPIDLGPSGLAGNIDHAVVIDKQILLFSEKSQSVMEGSNNLFSSKTVSVKPVTQEDCYPYCRPVARGTTVYFVTPKTDFDSIKEYVIQPDTLVRDAVDITAHVPRYIPNPIVKLASSPSENMLVALSSSDPDSLYVYKYYWDGEKKIQSSWSKWTLGTNTTVLSMDFIGSVLYLIIQKPDGVFLEKIRVSPKVTDTNSAYLTLLDRRLQENSSGVSSSYNAATNLTTFTIPYQITDTMQCVTRYDATVNAYPEGVILPVVSTPTTTTFTVSGDHTSRKVFIGETYTLRYRFSKQYVKEQSPGGGVAKISNGKLYVKSMSVDFKDTGFFTIENTPQYRDTYEETFTGLIVGSNNNVLNTVPLEEGTFEFPVLCYNTEMQVDIVNDSFKPSAFQSAGWEGDFILKSRRL